MATRPPAPYLERSQTGVAGRHFLVVIAAALLATAVFGVARYLLDLELDHAHPTRLTVGSVLTVSVIVSALGWSLLMALQRWTRRARTLWTSIAIGVTAISLLGPLTTPDFTPAGRVVGVLLHLAVAAVTIGLLRPVSFDRVPR